jgi:hypothetical protein
MDRPRLPLVASQMEESETKRKRKKKMQFAILKEQEEESQRLAELVRGFRRTGEGRKTR